MKLKKPKTMIMWITLGILLLVLIYDAWACMDREKRETVSEMITKASMRYTIIPFVAGILAGHFFWSQKNIWKRIRI